MEVDALSGSCMLVRRSALVFDVKGYQDHIARNGKLHPLGGKPLSELVINGGAGLLDESFFMYGEDLDWCFRIQQVGWRIYYTPETRIIHYKGESTKQRDTIRAALLRSNAAVCRQTFPQSLLCGVCRIATSRHSASGNPERTGNLCQKVSDSSIGVASFFGDNGRRGSSLFLECRR